MSVTERASKVARFVALAAGLFLAGTALVLATDPVLTFVGHAAGWCAHEIKTGAVGFAHLCARIVRHYLH